MRVFPAYRQAGYVTFENYKNRHMKRTLLNLFFILTVLNLFAQENFNVPSADKKTYNLYMAKDWKGLINTGKKSLKNGIDFYYLQMRMGIAYFELNKYAQAVKYFENVYSKTPDDEMIQEYLYYSYLFSGRFDDARLLGAYFNRKLKEKLNIESEYPFIRAVYFSTIQYINEDYKENLSLEENLKQKTTLNESWYNISFEHVAGKRLTFFHGYSHLKITNNIRDIDPDFPPEFIENINQNEYYFSAKYHASKGLNISGGFHYINTSYFAPNPLETWGRRQTNTALYYYSENAFAGSLNLSKSFSIFNTSFETSISDLNNKLQIQPSLSIRIYPFGNNNFYSETKGIYLSEKDGTLFNYHPVFKQSFGIRFLKYSFISPSITYGNLQNFTQYNTFLTNNDLDKITLRFENYLNIGLAKGRFNMFISYQYNNKENTFEVNTVEKTKRYVNQTITGGIKWYFKKY